MKRTAPLKQKSVNRSSCGKLVVSGRGHIDDSALCSGGVKRRVSAGPTGTSPVARRRCHSTGSSNDSRANVKKPRDYSNIRCPQSADTPIKALPLQADTAQVSAPKLQSVSRPSQQQHQRERLGSVRQTAATHGNSSRRCNLQVSGFVSTAAARAHRHSTGTDTAVMSSPRYNVVADPRLIVQRHAGSLSPPRKERPRVSAASSSRPLVHVQPSKKEEGVGEMLSRPPPAATIVVSAKSPLTSPEKPSLSASPVTVAPSEFSPQKESRLDAASLSLRTPPHQPTPSLQKDADDIDALDISLAPRLGHLPPMSADEGMNYFAEEASPLDVVGTPPSQGTRRKSSVWSSEQTNRSMLLNGSGATLPPGGAASRWETWAGSEDTVPLRSAEVPAVVVGISNAPGECPAKTASSADSSPMKLVSTHPVPSLLMTKTSTSPASQPRKKSSEKNKISSSGQASKSPNAKATASKVSSAPGLQKRTTTTAQLPSSPLRRKMQTKPMNGGRAGVAPPSPTANRVASPQTPTRTPRASSAASPTAGWRPSTSAHTPLKSTPLHPAAKGVMEGSSLQQRNATPSGTAATNVSLTITAATTTTSNDSDTPQKQQSTNHTTLHNQRVAAMLSQMLSVVRPMAPVVHVRIRPVLPSIGETNHQRHVYLLDHENVMVTGMRSGNIASGTAASAMSNLLSSSADYAAAKRIGVDVHGGGGGAAGCGGWGGTGRSHVDFMSVSPSAVLTNSTSGGWRGHKTVFSTGSATTSTSAAAVGGGLTSPTPATLYGGNSALLIAMSESPPIKHEVTTAATPADAKLHPTRSSPNTTPGLAQLQPLGFPDAPPELETFNHPRTASWLSQGSEEVAVGGRLSGGSHSISPPQLRLPPGGASTSLNSAVSTPHTRPHLAAFTAFTEDTLLSPTTTPRGLTMSGIVADGDATAGKRRGGRRMSALMQQSMSLSAMTAPDSQATTRKNLVVSGVSPQKGGARSGDGDAGGASGVRRLTSRSGTDASVSTPAMSMPTLLRGDVMRTPRADDLRRSRSPVHDMLTDGSTTFPEVSPMTTTVGFPGANGSEQHFSFEFVHGEDATQADVFEESVLRFADEALLAQNVAIICYGPTGSGKTYSMMGSQAQPGAAGGGVATTAGVVGAGKPFHRASNTQSSGVPAARATVGRSTNRRSMTGKGSNALGRRGSDSSSRATSAAEGRRRHAEDSSSAATEGNGTARQDCSVSGLIDGGEGEGDTWPQLGSSWQYGYTDHFMKRALTGDRHAATGTEKDGDNGWSRNGAAGGGSAGSIMTSASMAEMGILPRLVHTLLERRGEAITIRRESGSDTTSCFGGGGATSGAVGSSATNTPQPTPRPMRASKTTSLSLTLRNLTFYGIELYMDELCDLLDPGKRPIQTVSDTGGLAALCQRINEARDYRINGSRGGASQVCITAPRAGGGMPITSLADLRRAYRLAHGNRVTAKHAQNDTSSRSHAIFLLQLDFDLVEIRVDSKQQQQQQSQQDGTAVDRDEAPVETVQRVHSYVAMVDLAGCERVKQTKVEGSALREAQYINKSLSALSSVVLSLHRNNAHVPYRDSKLTRLLRPCLEGGRVLTLVHVAPCSSTETANTLKFADQIRHTHIPTHALTPTSSKHRELLDVFADLIDPMQGFWEAQVQCAQSQLNRLCADLRLAYFSRAVGAVTRLATSGHTLSPRSMPSDAISEVSTLTDVDDSSSLSPGDVSLEEGPPPLTGDATEREKRSFALHSLLHQLMGPIHQHQRTSMRDAIRAIRRRKEHEITSHQRDLQRRMKNLQDAVDNLTATNAKLASENRTPLPRDPYALELNRQLREATEQISETTKEQAALSTLMVALRQRLMNQDTLEATVDEQLHKVKHRTAQALQTLSAAAAAHPPGVVSPALLSSPSSALVAPSSPREPTLPTGSPVPATITMLGTDDDPELRDIAHQQISLSKELAALRLETACFEIGTGVWEGLWARAMRKEIVTALEVEVFAMERILLDRRALSLMLMEADSDENEAHETGGAANSRAASLSTPFKMYARGGDGKEINDDSASSMLASAGLLNKKKSPATLAAAMRSALWSRLGTYLHDGDLNDTAVAGVSSNDLYGAPTYLSASASGMADSQTGSPQTPSASWSPLLSGRHDGVSLAQPTATGTTTNSEMSESRMQGGTNNNPLQGLPGSPSSRTLQKSTEQVIPNPLTVLAIAHDEVMRQQQQQQQERNPQGALTSPPSPRRADVTAAAAAAPSSVAVAAALLPLTISGTYGDEQALQAACLQLLLRDGIPCEACCMGHTANYVLQHYVLPWTADAPLAEETDAVVKGGSVGVTTAPFASVLNASSTAAMHCAVWTLPPMSRDAFRHSDTLTATAGGSGKKNKRGAIDTPLFPLPPSTSAAHTPHARPGEAEGASCTARFGRLRLVRVPRRPNRYVLEFVYTHHGLPMSPRLQAALAGKSEDSLSPTPQRTNLEQMVDSLPSVQGVAGRGGTRTQGGPLKEHRLFAIPLHEPSLHLHLHVLEEGIPDMTTPVAAAWAVDAVDDAAVAGSCTDCSSSGIGARAATAPLCVARRAETGPQIVLELQGVPYTASTRRTVPVTGATEARAESLPGRSKKKQRGTTEKTGKKVACSGSHNIDDGRGYARLSAGTSKGALKSGAAAAGAELAASSAPVTSGWSDLVLAKRLSSGGELMLPSSCILSNKGCCSLVLRFPHPFFSAMTRTESVEAVVGALCGILRPALTVPEVRLSARSTRSPSKRSAAGCRRRRSASPGATSGGGGAERGNSSSSSPHKRCRSSTSHTPLPDDDMRAMELDVVTYAHVPYTMFAAEAPPATQKVDTTATASVERSVSSLACAPPSPAAGGRVMRTPSLSMHSASMARSDSFDGFVAPMGGVLGHTVQSSCSPGHGSHTKTHAATTAATSATTPVAGLSFSVPLSTSLVRRSSGSTTTTPGAADQQNGATLQVQFYWMPTPLEVELPRGATTRINGTVMPSQQQLDHRGTEHGGAGEGKGEPLLALRRETDGHGVGPLLPQRTLHNRLHQQMRAALGILAHLSYVYVEGQRTEFAATSVEASVPVLNPHANIENGARQVTGQSLTQDLAVSDSAHADCYKNAVFVATLLRQLDTYRQRIRRLFRQQLYDAEDILGDEVQLVGPDRGVYMRDVQAEVKQAIGLPGGSGGCGGAASSNGSPSRLNESNSVGNSGVSGMTTYSLLSPESGDGGPETQVTINEAREVCGAAVPWTIWQWAYRWSKLRRLLLVPEPHLRKTAPVTGSGGEDRPAVEAAAAWLPTDTRVSAVSAGAGLTTSHLVATSTSVSVIAPAGYASSSSSSSEGYVMEGDWLNEARYAARSKRVWLHDVLATTLPSYLESCAADYSP